MSERKRDPMAAVLPPEVDLSEVMATRNSKAAEEKALADQARAEPQPRRSRPRLRARDRQGE